MKKVTIEITPSGWTTTVQLGEKTIVERHVRCLTGAKGIEGNFEDSIDDENLYNALSGFAQYDIMIALNELQ